jgi:hypothetical protein
MQSNHDVQEVQRRKPSFWMRFLLVINFLVIASLAGGIFWTRYEGEQKQQELTERADIRYIDIQRQDMKLFALPLTWSVRKELMRSNYDQIDEYFNELIKRKGFSKIMLVDPSGIIKVSTDRKLQGGSFSRSYPGMNLGTSEMMSYPLQKGTSMVLVPVMGLSEKIGTIAFLYSYQEF